MINGSLLPVFFHSDVPDPGGTFFSPKYFALTYFSNYMPPEVTVPPSVILGDTIEFLLEVNRGVELSLEINKQLETELGIYTEAEITLTTNRQLEFTIER